MFFKYFKIFLLIILLLFFFTIIFYKPILLYSLDKSLTKWFEHEISIEKLNLDFKTKSINLKNIKVKSPENFKYKNIVEIKKLFLDIKISTIFDETVIFNKLVVINPIFYYEIKIEKNENFSDNLGFSQETETEKKKIYRIKPKKKDKNFKIKKVEIINAEANIFTPFFVKPKKIKLSTMTFKNIGNEKGITHYKDIFNYILVDITARIPNTKFRKLIKKLLN